MAVTSTPKLLKNGLTSFQLKWIALFFMTLDRPLHDDPPQLGQNCRAAVPICTCTGDAAY